VQKIPQVDDDLSDRRSADDDKNLYRPQRASGDEANGIVVNTNARTTPTK
jgi:hypothetical protein